MKKAKVSNTLIYSLAIISIIGFLGIMAEVWLDFDLIIKNASAYMLIVLGIGLAVEGQVKKWKNFRKEGYSNTEIVHVITGLIGIFAVVVGFLDLIGLTGSTLLATKGIISALAVVIITIQTWWVE